MFYYGKLSSVFMTTITMSTVIWDMSWCLVFRCSTSKVYSVTSHRTVT